MQIPTFLLLRELGWLKTFAALVIPVAANGFSIFLLKGLKGIIVPVKKSSHEPPAPGKLKTA